MSAPQLSDEYMQAHAHESKVWAIIGVGAALGLLVYVAVVARLVSRKIGGIALGIEDWLILGSLLAFTAYTVLPMIAAGFYGYGRHTFAITEHRMIRLLLMPSNIAYLYTAMLTKFSFLALYMRLFPGYKLRMVTYTTAASIIVATVAWQFLLVFQCVPMAKLWKPEIRGFCINEPAAFSTNGVFNMVTDIFIFLLPIPMLWRLHMPRRKKVLLTAVFLVGLIVVAVSIVRLPFLLKDTSADLSWGGADRTILTMIECGMGILCSCLSTYMPLYLRISGQMSSRRSAGVASGSFNSVRLNDLSRYVQHDSMMRLTSRSQVASEAVSS